MAPLSFLLFCVTDFSTCGEVYFCNGFIGPAVRISDGWSGAMKDCKVINIMVRPKNGRTNMCFTLKSCPWMCYIRHREGKPQKRLPLTNILFHFLCECTIIRRNSAVLSQCIVLPPLISFIYPFFRTMV